MDQVERDTKKVELILKALERVYPPLPQLLWRSFLSGVFTALGATVGLSIMLAVLTYVIGQLKLIPILSEILTRVQVEQIVR